jgi:two-component system, NtrC family, sensor kinase
MRRRSRAGGESAKAQRRKTAARKSRIAPKAVRPRSSSAAQGETKVARLTRERDEALEQQAATAEVLKVISRSTFDLETVLDALTASAARLCDADFAFIFQRLGDLLHLAASHGFSGDFIEYQKQNPVPFGRGSLTGRTALERKMVHIPDVLEDPEYTWTKSIELGRYRTMLGIPLLREGVAVGVIALSRRTVRPFTDRQIELVTTFADQAVIAIENVRLFEAEQQRTRELAESLKHQTATSDVLKVISRSTFDLQPILDTLVETAARLCQSDTGLIASRDGDIYRGVATFAYSPDYDEFWRNLRLKPTRATITGRAVLERRTIHITDVTADPEYKFPESVKLGRNRTLLGVPLLRDGEPIGVISFGRERVEPFTEQQIELVRTFADQAVIAIENTRLLNELRQRTDDLSKRTTDLSEALEQQTATSEVLRVISSSPGDLKLVFETMLASAARICDAHIGGVYRWDGEFAQLVATTPELPPAYAAVVRYSPFRPDPKSLIGRSVARTTAVQFADFTADELYTKQRDPFVVANVELGGLRTGLFVPMLKEGEPIGFLTLAREDVRPFIDKQIALVENFAAQAVIAIENTRLLNELRESLQQQTATADVLKVISRSTFDLQTVLETLIESAARLCAADKGTIQLAEGDVYRIRAHYGLAQEAVEYALLQPLRPGRSSAAGRVALEGKTIQIPDVLADPEYHAMDYQQAFGYRTILGVPLLRDGKTIGTFSLLRDKVSPFTDKQIELVTVFADQAVIAVENARLLTELRNPCSNSLPLPMFSRSSAGPPLICKLFSTRSSSQQLDFAMPTVQPSIAPMETATHMWRAMVTPANIMSTCGSDPLSRVAARCLGVL